MRDVRRGLPGTGDDGVATSMTPSSQGTYWQRLLGRPRHLLGCALISVMWIVSFWLASHMEEAPAWGWGLAVALTVLPWAAVLWDARADGPEDPDGV